MANLLVLLERFMKEFIFFGVIIKTEGIPDVQVVAITPRINNKINELVKIESTYISNEHVHIIV